MRKLFIVAKVILQTFYLIPFYIFMMFHVYSISKKMDIQFQNYLVDNSWMFKYLEEYESLGYKISTGVWLSIYTIYYLIK